MRSRWIVLAVLAVPVGVWSARKHEATLSIEQVPPAVRSTIENETQTQGGQVGPIERETRQGRTSYEAAVVRNGQPMMYVHIAEDGKVLKRESATDEQAEERREHRP